jgi:hypothetical protein
MTDNLERVFIEVAFEDGAADPDKVVEDLSSRLSGLPYRIAVSKNRPPRIFSDQELEERFFNIWSAAQKFRIRYLQRFGIDITVDPRLLYIAVISAFDDIARYKSYHLEKPYKDRSDAVKRSAFLTKWMVKVAPFQTIFDADIPFDKILDPRTLDAKPALANVFFAIMVSMTHISVDCRRRLFLEVETEFDLAYDLLFRRVNEDALLGTYKKIMDLGKGRLIVRSA